MKYINYEKRPWGVFYVIHDEDNYKLKRIEVDPSKRLSYQYHQKRSEVWVIINGYGTITLEGEEKECSNGQIIKIQKGMKHRIENKGNEKLVFIEVQTGDYFGEEDIIRIEDDYNRV